MRGCKTNNAALERKLEKKVPSAENIPKQHASVIDGMAIVNKIQGDKKTFQEISDSVLSLVLREGHEIKTK
jgi:hypothetical protein